MIKKSIMSYLFPIVMGFSGYSCLPAQQSSQPQSLPSLQQIYCNRCIPKYAQQNLDYFLANGTYNTENPLIERELATAVAIDSAVRECTVKLVQKGRKKKDNQGALAVLYASVVRGNLAQQVCGNDYFQRIAYKINK